MASARQNSSVSFPEIRLKVRVGNGAIGPGKIGLLEQINKTGSISAAARDCGMNYRRAQYLIETMTEALGKPVIETVVGGSRGGGARLSGAGMNLINAFRALEADAARVAEPHLGDIDEL